MALFPLFVLCLTGKEERWILALEGDDLDMMALREMDCEGVSVMRDSTPPGMGGTDDNDLHRSVADMIGGLILTLWMESVDILLDGVLVIGLFSLADHFAKQTNRDELDSHND